MADAIDRAAAAEAANTEDALANHRARVKLRQRRLESAEPCDPAQSRLCNGCEELIDQRRLALNPRAMLCTACAEDLENMMRGNRL